jgi:hypothetical protein
MTALLTRWTGWQLVAVALSTIAGCPIQAPQSAPNALDTWPGAPAVTPSSTILHALPPDLTALLNAPPVDAPTVGAAALANTSWSGTQDCVITGDYHMLLSGPGTNPLSDSLYFDERGIPSSTSGYGYQFKRATFTASSFDVACTAVMSRAMSGSYTSVAYVITLSGQRGADGRLAGRHRWGVIYSLDGPAADVAIVEDCAFTMTLDD